MSALLAAARIEELISPSPADRLRYRVAEILLSAYRPRG
jgi:hypothetical protein